jgi:hypothetical protein
MVEMHSLLVGEGATSAEDQAIRLRWSQPKTSTGRSTSAPNTSGPTRSWWGHNLATVAARARVVYPEPDLDQAMTGWAARRLLGVSGVSANSVTYRGRGGGSCRRWRNQAL